MQPNNAQFGGSSASSSGTGNPFSFSGAAVGSNAAAPQGALGFGGVPSSGARGAPTATGFRSFGATGVAPGFGAAPSSSSSFAFAPAGVNQFQQFPGHQFSSNAFRNAFQPSFGSRDAVRQLVANDASTKRERRSSSKSPRNRRHFSPLRGGGIAEMKDPLAARAEFVSTLPRSGSAASADPTASIFGQKVAGPQQEVGQNVQGGSSISSAFSVRAPPPLPSAGDAGGVPGLVHPGSVAGQQPTRPMHSMPQHAASINQRIIGRERPLFQKRKPELPGSASQTERSAKRSAVDAFFDNIDENPVWGPFAKEVRARVRAEREEREKAAAAAAAVAPQAPLEDGERGGSISERDEVQDVVMETEADARQRSQVEQQSQEALSQMGMPEGVPLDLASLQKMVAERSGKAPAEEAENKHAEMTTGGGSAAAAAASSSSASTAKSKAHLYVFTNEKNASYDKDLQLRVIEEMSKNSKHQAHALEQDSKLEEKIEKVLKQAEELRTELRQWEEKQDKDEKVRPAKVRRLSAEGEPGAVTLADLMGLQIKPRLLQAEDEADRFVEATLKRMKATTPTAAANKASDEKTKSDEAAQQVLEPKQNFCAVLDMDMYFAAVEIRDRPELIEKPVAVGGIGMISTSNYVARRYGVRSAMPGFIGVELCRRQRAELVFVSPDMEKYKRVSEEVQDVIKRFLPSDSVKVPSMDEMFLNLNQVYEQVSAGGTDAIVGNKVEPDVEVDDGDVKLRSLKTFDEAIHLVAKIRKEITRELRLTCSAGIGPNFMLAKMAADVQKPNGQFCVPVGKESRLAWLRGQSVRKVSGVGKVTQRILNKLGIETVQHLHEQRGLLFGVLTPGVAQFLVLAKEGVPVQREEKGVQSVSVERTFGGGRWSNRGASSSQPDYWKTMVEKVKSAARETGEELRKKKLEARTVTVKGKTAQFVVTQRSKTLAHWFSDDDTLVKLAVDLFEENWLVLDQVTGNRRVAEPLRLLGVRASNLREPGVGPLFGGKTDP